MSSSPSPALTRSETGGVAFLLLVALVASITAAVVLHYVDVEPTPGTHRGERTFIRIMMGLQLAGSLLALVVGTFVLVRHVRAKRKTKA